MSGALVRASFAVLLLWGCANTPLYAPCDDGSECEDPSDGCYALLFDRSDGTQGSGNVCSRRCVTDSDCPGGLCLALRGDPSETFLCFETCAADRCFDPHACTPLDGAMGSVCLP